MPKTDAAFKHHTPGEKSASQIKELRVQFQVLAEMIDYLPAGREKSLAQTNLEQAAMWANKAAVLGDPESKPE